MKKILNNKYVLFGVAFILGATFIWMVQPSDHQDIKPSKNQVSKNEVFTCSMHPQIRQYEPGNCPICGMTLVPLEEDTGGDKDPLAVSMSPTSMRLANVVTAVVGKQQATKTLRLNGKVQEDERLITSQSTHFPGRIERLTLNFTGEYVSKGSTIAYLYSPQLVTAQEELLETYKIRESQPTLYQAAREKLKNWKLNDQQIDQIISTGKIEEEFPVRADQSGYVTSKKVNLGDYVKRGQTLYEIANLSRVWILFDVYESDLPWVNKGDDIECLISSLPGKVFNGKIDYIDPVIDPKTRVARARVVIENKDLQLKPEMFATGVVKATMNKSGDQLTVPKSAVMWTGKRSVVYVKLQTDQGLYFKMREVILGPALGDEYIIEEGIEPGEEIVVNGTFSIDAAAQLAGKPSMMNPEMSTSEEGNDKSDHDHSQMDQMQDQVQTNNLQVNEFQRIYEVVPSFKNQLKSVYTAYLPVKNALVKSDIKMAGNKANTLLGAIQKVDMTLVTGEAHMAWMKDVSVLKSTAKGIIAESKLEQVRLLFSPLSDQLFHTLKKYQVKVDGYRQFCPMVLDFKGAYWLSSSEEILNPYFGDEMLNCGEISATLE
ncbi:efflux RND transporter periplasmic adaptor subunit [Marinoscillum sp. MHG1-6]|uniref:efflux RND transporter periplasmic adaptor subunit n=1 Tax=Marinoscillum sp. MHG1-6 TaxID=2959627 RepID=UPI0021583A3F|nr:efflux RND transporter periplasmic adaptor subunit [Marinoscillum sp. MHG1-6]